MLFVLLVLFIKLCELLLVTGELSLVPFAGESRQKFLASSLHVIFAAPILGWCPMGERHGRCGDEIPRRLSYKQLNVNLER